MVGLPRLAGALGAVAALALHGSASPLSARQFTAMQDPTVDPFYAAPSNLSAYALGAVIRRRPVSTVVQGPFLKQAYQVLYRTLRTDNSPDANVATVFVPSAPKTGADASIFSYQFYEDSTSFDCSPSYALASPTTSPNVATAALDTPIALQWALANGFYAVASDHEGTQAAFIGGYQEGRAILDAIRATIHDQQLPAKSKVGLYGYSGGAHATVWATSLAASHAPELNIIGAAHGGTPVDTRNIFNFLNGGPFSAFAGLGVAGLANAYADLNAWLGQHLTAQGKQFLALARSKGFCLGQAVLKLPFTNFYKYIDVPNPLDQPIPAGVLAKETLLQEHRAPGDTVPVPGFPRLLLHSLEDEIVEYADAATYVREQCAAGADIAFVTFPISEHISGEVFSLPGALAWLEAAYNGGVKPGTFKGALCGLPTPNFANVFTPQAVQTIGQDNVNKLLALRGTKSPFGTIISF